MKGEEAMMSETKNEKVDESNNSDRPHQPNLGDALDGTAELISKGFPEVWTAERF